MKGRYRTEQRRWAVRLEMHRRRVGWPFQPRDYRASAFVVFAWLQAPAVAGNAAPTRLGFRETYRKNLKIARQYRQRLKPGPAGLLTVSHG